MIDYDSSFVKIDLDIIEENFSAVAKKAGVGVMAVVKADAYGHGAVQVARALEARCAFFGVSSMLEALELRQAGIEKPILILGHTPVSAFREAIRLDVRPAIFRYEDGLALSQEARRQGKTAPFHFALDTGMSRIGFQADWESAQVCAKIARLPGLYAEGLFSHFASADSADLTRAMAQAEKFGIFDGWLRELGVNVPLRHLDNSAGLMNFTRHYEMVRSGIVTYGLYPSPEVERERLPIRPALSWYSRVSMVKLLPAGREISYGGTWVTKADTLVATVPVGYADGYRRSLSNRFYVLIHGRKAPILGRICMDQMMVDVTNLPQTQVGDRVTLVGTDGDLEITMEEISREAGSFPYEFVCGISRRVPRLYRRNGHTTHSVHYLLSEEKTGENR